jgi:hypothetical protein
MDKTSITILNLFAERTSLNCQELAAILNTHSLEISKHVSFLFSEKYITPTELLDNNNHFSIKTHFRITPIGCGFLEELSDSYKQNLRDNILKWCNFALSVIAIIISIISLLKK